MKTKSLQMKRSYPETYLVNGHETDIIRRIPGHIGTHDHAIEGILLGGLAQILFGHMLELTVRRLLISFIICLAGRNFIFSLPL